VKGVRGLHLWNPLSLAELGLGLAKPGHDTVPQFFASMRGSYPYIPASQRVLSRISSKPRLLESTLVDMSSILGDMPAFNKKPMSLREEIRQTKPFQSSAQEAILGLYRTSDVLRRHFSNLIETHGVSLQQYNVMRILRGAGKGGMPTLDIADRMIEKTPGITRLLDKLEAKQLVRRKRCPKDRRQVLCWITGSGLRLLAALDKPLAAAGSAAMRALSNRQLRALISQLEAIRAHLA
jgi:MarR family transcriptional regulator, organic hydroperoxide resistance regulator